MTTLTVYAAAFRDLLGNLRGFAVDAAHPDLSVIRLAGLDGQLVGMATDRHVMARDHVPADGDLPPFLISLSDADRLYDVLRPSGMEEESGSAPMAKLALDGRLTVSVGGSSVWVWTKPVDGFPTDTLDAILGRWTSARSDSGVAVAPGLLAKFIEVAQRSGPHFSIRMWHYGPSAPVHVKIGPTFHGTVMPMRSAVTALREERYTSVDVPEPVRESVSV